MATVSEVTAANAEQKRVEDESVEKQFPFMSEAREKALLNQLGEEALTPNLGPSLSQVRDHVRCQLACNPSFIELRELAHCLNHAAMILDPDTKNHTQ